MNDKDKDVEFENAKEELLELRKKFEQLNRKKNSLPPYCSFCGRGKGEYLLCIEGPNGVRICENCTFDAYEKVIDELG